MAINAVWNRHFGPGGGTRHLHNFRRQINKPFEIVGMNLGSTCVIKELAFARYDITVIESKKINANDNFVVANDNFADDDAFAVAA